MSKKNILLLTLVHPDFLPPVYAAAQSLRDLDYNVHILTFDSLVPAQYDLGSNIALESVGRHYDANTLQRVSLRKKFVQRAKELRNDDTIAIISFCPFSYYCGLKIKGSLPVLYIALEIADFMRGEFWRSPLSNYRNLWALRHIREAALIATPSLQRSAWLAGRCHLDIMPYTILNTAYISGNTDAGTATLYKEIVPASFLAKKIILYTGAVNTEHCIMELAEAFDMVNDEGAALVVTGIRDNPYCDTVKEIVGKMKSKERILLLPYVTRMQMLALQSNSDIGVCLEKETDHNIRSKMMAPNKAGEYLSKNLYIIGANNEYLRPLEMKGIASLAKTVTANGISGAIKEALQAVQEKDYKMRIKTFVSDYFCMQQQIKPIAKFLNKISSSQ